MIRYHKSNLLVLLYHTVQPCCLLLLKVNTTLSPVDEIHYSGIVSKLETRSPGSSGTLIIYHHHTYKYTSKRQKKKKSDIVPEPWAISQKLLLLSSEPGFKLVKEKKEKKNKIPWKLRPAHPPQSKQSQVTYRYGTPVRFATPHENNDRINQSW